MNPNQKRVHDFIARIPAQAKALRDTPGLPPLDVRILRARLMMEELIELIQDGLGLDIWIDAKERVAGVGQFTVNYEDVHFEESHVRKPNVVLVADGLADCEVVNMGTAAVCGIDSGKVFDAVMDNNDLKIDRGTIDGFGKLVKPADHKPPDIRAVLVEQGLTE